MPAAKGYRIRVGTSEDLEAMYQMDVLCFDEVFRFSRAAMSRFTQGSNRFTLIAEDTLGEMAGFVIVSLHRKYDLGYVVTLDVAPRFRRQGVASLLMQAAEQHAAADPLTWLELHVYRGNAAALALYTTTGYQETGVQADFYGDGLDSLVLRKRLLAG